MAKAAHDFSYTLDFFYICFHKTIFKGFHLFWALLKSISKFLRYFKALITCEIEKWMFCLCFALFMTLELFWEIGSEEKTTQLMFRVLQINLSGNPSSHECKYIPCDL